MKLLFDENLSFRLVQALKNEFPGSVHVTEVNLERSRDNEIWLYASNNGFCIVTKDHDFNDLAIAKGLPPKVIHLATGNKSTDEILQLLKKEAVAIRRFLEDDHNALMLLTGRK